MQMYYYLQKLQTAGMGNPKERKECPICGKTLYDRSTWNRHMRIHTGTFYCISTIQHNFIMPTLVEPLLVLYYLYKKSSFFLSLPLFSGEKPYPCRFCGRRFRTNYNKLGHEKKCPDRHARAVLQPATPDSPSVVPSVVYR